MKLIRSLIGLERIHEQGAEHGFRVCVSRMLTSGTRPEFIAKIIDVDLNFVLDVKDSMQE